MRWNMRPIDSQQNERVKRRCYCHRQDKSSFHNNLQVKIE